MEIKLQSIKLNIIRLDGLNGIIIVCSLYGVAILSIIFLKETKHKLALKKSFIAPAE